MTAGSPNMTRDLLAATAGLPLDGDPTTEGELLALLRTLYAVGRRDLPLGRLLEGHVDAVQIVLRYGLPDQRRYLRQALAAGALLGVWNADLPGEPLQIEDGRLTGAKSFASGAGVLTHALVTAGTRDGAQLVLVELGSVPPEIDTGWWHVVGMQRSETHRVRWSNAALHPNASIGHPGDYAREPWFSGGALRFLAVHAGGAAAVFDVVRDHLVGAGRADDPFQSARLADLLVCGERAASAVRRGARAMYAPGQMEMRLASVAAARIEVLDAAERALAVAQQAVGVQGLFVEHPLVRIATDLSVYLRQPAPDAQRLRAGAAAAQGVLAPIL